MDFHLLTITGFGLMLVSLIILIIKNFKIKELYKKQEELYKTHLITLSTVYNSVPDLIFCKDTEARYISYNPSFQEFAGSRAAEIIGKTSPEFFTGDKEMEVMAEGFLRTDKLVLYQKVIAKEEAWLTYPNGSRKLFEIVKVPMFQDGKLIGLLGVSRDITEHKKMMIEIERQNNLLNTVNHVSAALLEPDVEKFEESLLYSMNLLTEAVSVDRVRIWRNSIDDGEFYCKQIYQWSLDTGLWQDKNPIGKIYYDERIPDWENILSKGNCINNLVRHLSPNEKEQLSLHGILSILVVPVFLEEKFWGFVSFDDYHSERIFTDNEELILRLASRIITSALIRNNMTREIQTTAAQLEAVVANYPGLICCVNQNSNILLFDDLDLKEIGLTPAFITGRKLDEAKREPLPSDIINCIYKTFVDGAQDQVFKTEKEVYRVRTTPIYDDKNDIISVVGGIDDITEIIRLQDDLEKALVEASAASKAKSDFLAKMSHEIRTPMNAIIGMTELALRENELSATHRHVLTVKQAGAHLLSIINDILDFSKIEMGKLEIIMTDYLFSSLANDVISIIRMRVIDTQIRFAVNIDCNIPNNLIGDETRIRQVLLNLLSNAVKYTDNGFVSFTVYGEQVEEDSIVLKIEIMDSGKGIKPEDIDSLFGEYVQVDQEKNIGIEGVGLGLAITRNIVNAMGGSISVYSEYGIGSLFSVTLPQKIRSPEVLAVVEDPEKKSVIVYERREIYANSIICTIDNLGVDCTIVSNDFDLLEKMKSRPYPFVFISFALYNRNLDTLNTFGANAKIVLLTEFGEAIKDKNFSVLAMPVYSISVANILNGVANSFNYNENFEQTVRFTAPEARILIVDDINTNLKVAEGLLLPYNMQVDLCKSGKAAIDAVMAKHYDLILMDHKMPEMDGVEATEYIRNNLGLEDRYYRKLPIIALTANAVYGIKEMFMEKGFNDFLSKPIDTIKLNSVLEKWIPKEKQKTTISEEVIIDDIHIPINIEKDAVIDIEGLDFKIGISLSGGSMTNYLDILSIYYRDGLEKINEIQKCLENDDLSLYTIYVHALKSASANIGAADFSAAAKAMETAGEKNDLDYIKTNNEGFLLDFKQLLNRIYDFLTAYKDKNNNAKNTIDVELLKEELRKLKTALEAFDAGTINRTIEGLQSTVQADETGIVVNNIFDKVLFGDYEEAAVLIESILSEAKNEAL